MKAFSLALSFLIPAVLVAAEPTLSVVDTGGKTVEVPVAEISKALKADFEKNNLRSKKVTTVRNSVVIESPEILVDGTWYPFVETARYGTWTSNICRTFNRAHQINVGSNRRTHDKKVRVNSDGDFAEISDDATLGEHVRSITCSVD